jgi:hypothetical protein
MVLEHREQYPSEWAAILPGLAERLQQYVWCGTSDRRTS